MRGWLAAAALLVALAPPMHAAGEVPEQTVTPIIPPHEQRVDPVNPKVDQQVQALNTDGTQDVSGGTKSPVGRAATKVGKVVVGVFAAAVSVGVMMATLLLL